MEDQKKAVRDNLGPIPEVTVDFMLHYIIPNSNVDVDATMFKLREAGVWSETYRWQVSEKQTPHSFFNFKTVADSEKENQEPRNVEIDSYSRMKHIYDYIISSAQFLNGDIQEPALVFEQMPNSVPDADETRRDFSGALKLKQDLYTTHIWTGNPTYNSQSTQWSHSKHSPLQQAFHPNWFSVACVTEYKTSNRLENLNDVRLCMLSFLLNIDKGDRMCLT